MQVVYFEVIQQKEGNINGQHIIDCFYIPEEVVILYKKRYGNLAYSLTNAPPLLKRAREIAEGRTLNETNVTTSSIKKFECDDQALKDLINKINSKTRLEIMVRSDMEKLFLKLVQ